MTLKATHIQHGNNLSITVPMPTHGYLDQMLRLNCFPEIIDLFKNAGSPAKELTESYAAFHQLRKFHKVPRTVLHIGDGAHARTSGMFALLTRHSNISIDPNINNVPRNWADKHSIDRIELIPKKFEDYSLSPSGRFIVTLVHAHIHTDEVLDSLGDRWDACYVLSCCQPLTQLSNKYQIYKEGFDYSILSPERHYQVLVPTRKTNDFTTTKKRSRKTSLC